METDDGEPLGSGQLVVEALEEMVGSRFRGPVRRVLGVWVATGKGVEWGTNEQWMSNKVADQSGTNADVAAVLTW